MKFKWEKLPIARASSQESEIEEYGVGGEVRSSKGQNSGLDEWEAGLKNDGEKK